MKTLLFEIAKIHNPRKKIDGASVQDRSMTLHDVGKHFEQTVKNSKPKYRTTLLFIIESF